MVEPVIEFKSVSYRYPDTDKNVFTDLNIKLESGFTSLVGQNGSGKSTFLLLAGGRFLPDAGTVKILGTSSSELTDEETRNKIVSFVYQNMEFETEEPMSALFEFVASQGNNPRRSTKLIPELVDAFSLSASLNRKMQEMSKGDIQKSLIVFSLLYSSPLIIMDEPVFALENNEKEKIMEYLSEYARSSKTSLLVSIHELDLSRKYAGKALLFPRDRGAALLYGKTDELLVPSTLEDLYGVPAAMLYEKEHLYRKHLKEEHALLKSQRDAFLKSKHDLS